MYMEVDSTMVGVDMDMEEGDMDMGEGDMGTVAMGMDMGKILS